MKKQEQLYEGKAKKVFSTDDERYVIVDYKDDATAFNGKKKGTILGKGVVNNKVTNHLMQMLAANGVPTHFVEEISDRETVVKKVKIIPLEVIVRNVAAGSFSKRFGVEEGRVLAVPTIEFCLKDDALGDPMINTYHIKALNIAKDEEIETLKNMSFRINELLKAYFRKLNIDLIDFKLEFGKTADGEIVLADEISPDTCRFWDSSTHDKLDKDRFRRNLGGEAEAYQEVYRRIFG